MPGTQPNPSVPLKRSARLAGLRAQAPPPLPTSRRRGRKPAKEDNVPVHVQSDGEAERRSGEMEQDTDSEIDQLAHDTSLFGFTQQDELQGSSHHHRSYADQLGDETLDDLPTTLDKDHYSEDEYEEFRPLVDELLDLASSESSFVILGESDKEMALPGPTTTPAIHPTNPSRSLSDSYSDSNDNSGAKATVLGSKRKRNQSKETTRKVSNKARRTASPGRASTAKGKAAAKPCRRRTASTRRCSKSTKGSESDKPKEDSSDKDNTEPIEPLGDPADKNDKAMKSLTLKMDASYQSFQYKVAEGMNRSVRELPRLSWKFSTAKLNAKTLVIETEFDFDAMVEHVRERAEEERDKVVKVAHTHKRGSKKVEKSKMSQKPVEVDLVQKPEAISKSGRKSSYGGNLASASTGKQQQSALDLEGIIRSRNECTLDTCGNFGNTCWQVVDQESGATRHTELSAQNILLWVNLVRQGRGELAFPPPSVLIYNGPNKKAGPKADGNSKSGPSQPHTNQQVAPQSGHKGGGNGTFKLQLDIKAPLLSAWLLQCEQNNRGEPGDKFAWLTSGFEKEEICRLTDLRDVKPEFLQSLKFEQDGSVKKLSGGLALRLVRLVREDLEQFDHQIAALRNN
ncbi:hypothetical protein FRC06_009448 [Ceratobasidium sp. 370]|nr:hypothetical protein FRC06_009448 [Ceratobasidium sp. 370]